MTAKKNNKKSNKASAPFNAVCKFSDNSVSFTTGKLSVKMCKLRKGIKVTTKTATGTKKDALWDASKVSLTSNEHSHKAGDKWNVSVNHNTKDRINCTFESRDMARDFRTSFKKVLLTK